MQKKKYLRPSINTLDIEIAHLISSNSNANELGTSNNSSSGCTDDIAFSNGFDDDDANNNISWE
jgi:hypothetical protein